MGADRDAIINILSGLSVQIELLREENRALRKDLEELFTNGTTASTALISASGITRLPKRIVDRFVKEGDKFGSMFIMIRKDGIVEFMTDEQFCGLFDEQDISTDS